MPAKHEQLGRAGSSPSPLRIRGYSERKSSATSNTPSQDKAPRVSRWSFLRLFTVTTFMFVVCRLFYWQVLQRAQLQAIAAEQYQRVVTPTANRGQVLTSDGYTLVTNRTVYRLFAELNRLNLSPSIVAAQLAPQLWAPASAATPSTATAAASSQLSEGVSAPTATPTLTQSLLTLQQQLESKLSRKDTRRVALQSQISAEQKAAIEAMKISGIGFEPYQVRAYPEASMAAHVVGFVGKDTQGKDQGYFGVEGAMDSELRGFVTAERQLRDALGFRLGRGSSSVGSLEGRTVMLTLRRDVQHMVETELQLGLAKYGAASGEVIVMEPQTGKILAMAAFPSYDPAHFSDATTSLYRNPLLTDVYEPGSTFKVLTVAAGLDAGVITPETPCTSCAGPRTIGEYTLKTWNEEYHPGISMRDALAKSDNVAMIFIAEKLGTEKFREYVQKFGIGQETRIELQEDTQTPIRENWKLIDLATSSFGQGIATTGMQMVRAVGAVANHGKMMKPTIIEKVIDQSTHQEVLVQPQEERQTISQAAASQTTEMMVYAASQGEAKWTASRTHLVAGKTGTAQVPIAGHYDEKKTVASFIGFSPPENPRFVMLVKLREPTSSPWAAETAAPLWYRIADRLYLLLNVPPDR